MAARDARDGSVIIPLIEEIMEENRSIPESAGFSFVEFVR